MLLINVEQLGLVVVRPASDGRKPQRSLESLHPSARSSIRAQSSHSNHVHIPILPQSSRLSRACVDLLYLDLKFKLILTVVLALHVSVHRHIQYRYHSMSTTMFTPSGDRQHYAYKLAFRCQPWSWKVCYDLTTNLVFQAGGPAGASGQQARISAS